MNSGPEGESDAATPSIFAAGQEDASFDVCAYASTAANADTANKNPAAWKTRTIAERAKPVKPFLNSDKSVDSETTDDVRTDCDFSVDSSYGMTPPLEFDLLVSNAPIAW